MSHSESDPATWNEASETVDFAAEIDSREDLFREVIDRRWPGGKPSKGAREMVLGMVLECLTITRDEDSDGGSVGALLVKLADILTMSHSPTLALECLRFCFNLSPQSQTEIAERHKVSRAAVSRICVNICDRMGVLPGRGMKSEAAREAYRDRANEVHEKREPAVYPEVVDYAWSDAIDVAFDIAAKRDDENNHHQIGKAA